MPASRYIREYSNRKGALRVGQLGQLYLSLFLTYLYLSAQTK